MRGDFINPAFIQDNYSDWLATIEWDYFCTFTTRYDMTLKSARRVMEGYFKFLSKGGDGTMFWAAEAFKVRNSYHTHALLKAPPMFRYKNLIDIWQTVSGNKGLTAEKWNRVDLRKYNPKLGASGYVAKYITKTVSDYDIYTNGQF